MKSLSISLLHFSSSYCIHLIWKSHDICIKVFPGTKWKFSTLPLPSFYMISSFNFIFHPISTLSNNNEKKNNMKKFFTIFTIFTIFIFPVKLKKKNVPYMKQTEFLYLSTFKSTTCEGPWIWNSYSYMWKWA